ncbi:hypothetical protein QUA13_26380 [Microcoleus sp. S28C3]|uniref:hypothetical protein n=1 Tax=Microcoleus sp. S28C3 TaxID=3055414 RepID=UPI002FD6FBB8
MIAIPSGFSPEDYLALERDNTVRHEYRMSGRRNKEEEGSSATDSLDGCNGCQEEGRRNKEEGRREMQLKQ